MLLRYGSGICVVLAFAREQHASSGHNDSLESLMASLFQALSDKAKETRSQFTRSDNAPATSKVELQTTRGPAVLTEPIQLTAREPILSTSQLQPDSLKTEDRIAGDQKDRIQAAVSSSLQRQEQAQPLSNNLRLYLLAFGAACLIYNHAGSVLYFFRTTGIGLLDLVAVVCLVAAAPALPRTQMNETLQAIKLQATSAGVAVRALPQMSVEITAMLDEIRAMRRDLGAMAKKTAWLPGS